MSKVFRDYLEFAVNYYPKLVEEKYKTLLRDKNFFYQVSRILAGKTPEPSIEEIREELVTLKQDNPKEYAKLEKSLTKRDTPFFSDKQLATNSTA
jgi:hypothetical protein